MSLTEMEASASRARAAAKFFADKDEGLPPLRPRARAASNPARVRSRMISRSNSAMAEKMVKIKRPPRVFERRDDGGLCKMRGEGACSFALFV